MSANGLQHDRACCQDGALSLLDAVLLTHACHGGRLIDLTYIKDLDQHWLDVNGPLSGEKRDP